MNQEGSGIFARLFLLVAIALGALTCVALVWVMVAGALNNLTVAGPIIAGIFALVAYFASASAFALASFGTQAAYSPKAEGGARWLVLARSV
jgi:hypothetical protein